MATSPFTQNQRNDGQHPNFRLPVNQALGLALSLGVVFQIMTLWDLLIAVCFVMPMSGALLAAKLIRAGVVGYGLSVLIGLMLGLGCAWIVHKTGAIVYNRLKQRDDSVQNRYFRLLYLGAMLWIVFALFLGLWITSPILRAFKL